MIDLDGRTGEGGGQLVRIAIGLAALTTQAIRITNVRGNRPRTGLASQHVTAIRWLADATAAKVTGLGVGSSTLTFAPQRSPRELLTRDVAIEAPSTAASAALMLQTVLPFLVFAGHKSGAPINLRLAGATNASFAPSYEYLDQVLFPTLEERLGIRVGRRLERRGWSLGPLTGGVASFTIQPVALGGKLAFTPMASGDAESDAAGSTALQVQRVDVTMLVPGESHAALQSQVARDLAQLFPESDVQFRLVEDSGRDARWYVLLVAHSACGARWASDELTSLSKKAKSRDAFVARLSSQVCRGLRDEVRAGGVVDRHMQDQLVCLQALCEGVSCMPRGNDDDDKGGPGKSEGGLAAVLDDAAKLRLGQEAGKAVKATRAAAPFGHGSLHAQTARWVCAEMLPGVRFFNGGDIVRGVGMSVAREG